MKNMISLNRNPNIAVALALFDYQAAGGNQISFLAGDKLVISSADVEVVESGQDWVFARHTATLAEGFVPSNFLQVASAEEESKSQILADIKDLRYQIQAELSFKDGLRDIIRKSRDPLEKKNAQNSLSDTEKTIDELEEQLDKLEMAFKSAYAAEELDPESDMDEDENWEYLFEPITPIKPFTGELKSIMKTKPAAAKKNVRFNCRRTLSELQEEIELERGQAGAFEKMSFDELLGLGTSDMVSPVDPPPRRGSLNTPATVPPAAAATAPPRRSSLSSSTSTTPTTPQAAPLASSHVSARRRGSKESNHLPTPKGERAKPQKKQTSVADLVDPVIKGNLQHYSHSGLKSWTKRYCVLKDSVLYVYKKPTDPDTYDKMVLPSYKMSPCNIGGKEWAFKAEHPGCKPHIFAAENKEEFTNWLNALSLATIVISADLSNRKPQIQTAEERKQKKRMSIEGAKEGQALKTFRNSIHILEEENE